jgi:predicted CXXCH cytochrome family protein
MYTKGLLFVVIQVVLSIWCAPLFAETCAAASCHSKLITQKQPHQPVKDMDCAACHKQISPKHPGGTGKAFSLTASGSQLCFECHTPLGKAKNVHEPVKSGECLECHKVHGASGKYLLENSEDLTQLCTKCHDSAAFKHKFVHGPVAAGACTKCHDPHQSAEKFLVKGTIRSLCLTCHNDLAKFLQADPVVHKPVQSGNCTLCHGAHGAAFRGLLKKKIPELCIECHPNIGKRMADLKVPHKPLQDEGGCGTCHAPHSAKAKGLLPSDGKSVCLSCHGRNDLGKPPLLNISKELEGKKFLHGPLLKGECKGCHDPHGSNNFRMLTGSYPGTLYFPYKEGSYDFCLQCHDKNLLRFAETTLYTKFRNGNRNLHFVHVTDKRKGRSCRFCHEAHASNGEKLISIDGAKLGDWRVPLNFKITSTGGSCAPGCHQAFKYDRVKPEAY